MQYVGSTTSVIHRLENTKSKINALTLKNSLQARTGLEKHFQQFSTSRTSPGVSESDSFGNVCDEQREDSKHEAGEGCRCSECEKLKNLEDKWICRLGTFHGHLAWMNVTRWKEGQGLVIEHWRVTGGGKSKPGFGWVPWGWNKKQMMFEFCCRVFTQFDFEAKLCFPPLHWESRPDVKQNKQLCHSPVGWGLAMHWALAGWKLAKFEILWQGFSRASFDFTHPSSREYIFLSKKWKFCKLTFIAPLLGPHQLATDEEGREGWPSENLKKMKSAVMLVYFCFVW